MTLKKREFTVSLLLLFLIVTTQSVNFAEANMIPLMWFPTKPDETPPRITIYSPSENNVFVSSNDSITILLNFTVNKPREWFSSTKLSEDYMPGTLESVVRVVSYNYTIDGNESKNIPVDDNFHLTGSNPNETLRFSSNLTLSKGAHNITIDVECMSAYVEFEGAGNGYKTVTFYGHSQPVNFTITNPDFTITNLEPFPTALFAAGATLVAVVSVGVLIYFKKRKH
jgi:hypothetical protein